MHADQELDTSGLSCPLPLLKTRKSLAAMQPGQVLRIIATDPGSTDDIKAFADHAGHVLLSSTSVQGRHVHLLRKG